MNECIVIFAKITLVALVTLMKSFVVSTAVSYCSCVSVCVI